MLSTSFWARYILYDTEAQSIEVGNLHILTLKLLLTKNYSNCLLKKQQLFFGQFHR